MVDYLVVSTAAESHEAAMRLARSAVAAKLAASAHVTGPVSSVFWHEGRLGEGEEWQTSFKTTAARYTELETHILERHPWTNPEVSAVPLVSGSAPYLEWIGRTVASDRA
ncbi:divalent-cation tolerance protein CutA [Embleya sp. MST-111070]|uniref:divalent-cation tolerance protein CutA n=1 Tax=Embleya sp. MST-111070 TaxID=3398231 RepID=UPI003F735D15